VVVVSDHVQDTVDGPGIDLRAHLDGDSIVVDEGSAALVAGLLNPQVLSAIDGVEGWTLLTDGNVLAWCEVGRYFGPYESPILRGAHGGAHTRSAAGIMVEENWRRLLPTDRFRLRTGPEESPEHSESGSSRRGATSFRALRSASAALCGRHQLFRGR
jgi:hypothetical protein